MPQKSIFDKLRLTPGQLRAAADKRLGDARCLLDSRQNARNNGVLYLCGFTVECLLKAKLVETHPWLQTTRTPEKLAPAQARLWFLCYRSHQLEEILDSLPAIKTNLLNYGQRDPTGQKLFAALHNICAQWTVYVRYSPRHAPREEAQTFFTSVEDLRLWLL